MISQPDFLFGLHWIDITVIAIYFICIIGIGLYTYAKVKTQSDYFLGGRRFGKAMMMMFTFGSGTHADAAIAVAAKSYQIGLAGIWYQWQALVTTGVYWLLAPVYRRSRCVTNTEFFERRYGTSFGVLYTVNGVFINIVLMSVVLFGSGRLIEALTGQAISLPWAIALLVVIFTVYGVAGGLIAAVWTDFFQGILTIVMSFLLLPYMWKAVGGRQGLQERLPDFEALLSLEATGEITLAWILLNGVNSLVIAVALPHIIAQTSAGKTEMEGRFGLVAGALIKRVCTVAWALAGVFAIAFYRGTEIQADHVFGQAVRDFLPVGVVGLMVACVMASVMSTCDVYMISVSALLTRNVYRRFLVKDSSEEMMVRFARLSSVGFVALAVAMSFLFEDVTEAMRYMWKTVPMIGISFFLGLWWRQANRYGAWTSYLVGVTAMVFGQFILKLEGDAYLPHLLALYLGSGLMAGVLVSLITPSEQERQLDEFYLTINTPIGREDILRKNKISITLE